MLSSWMAAQHRNDVANHAIPAKAGIHFEFDCRAAAAIVTDDKKMGSGFRREDEFVGWPSGLAVWLPGSGDLSVAGTNVKNT